MGSPVPKPDGRRQRKVIAEHRSASRVPVSGRVGRPPNCPIELGDAGRRWWRWAWTTPQATRWNKGFLEPLARRAALEDTLAACRDNATDVAKLLPIMVRIDTAFGLTPLSAAQQHLQFVDDEPTPAKGGNGADGNVTPIRSRLKGMRET
jgi:hypothetical protein